MKIKSTESSHASKYKISKRDEDIHLIRRVCGLQMMAQTLISHVAVILRRDVGNICGEMRKRKTVGERASSVAANV